ncbi:hypothetical protein EON65_13500 [archaeon]|nr:MAG: hypothetical protein EON65_13500 [archaeon]
MDDILREKASETGCTEDRVFFDFDDDHVFEHHADHSASMVDLSHTSRAIAFHSPGVEESSIISKKQLPGYLSVALYIFHRYAAL